MVETDGRRIIERKHLDKTPNYGSLEITSTADKIVIFRKDGITSLNAVVNRMGDSIEASGLLREEYDHFFAGVAEAFRVHMGENPQESVEVHVFDEYQLDRAVREKVGDLIPITLDPLFEGIDFSISRGYLVGGIGKKTPIARPGTDVDIKKRAQKIAEDLKGKPAAIVDDNLNSGDSIRAALEILREAGVNIVKVVTGIQLGDGSHLDDLKSLGIIIDPVVKYTPPIPDAKEHLIVAEPRDFLLGLSGLVVKLPNGEVGRAPFVMPFTSPTDKLKVPLARETQFSLDILALNILFYQRMEEHLGKPVLLAHMEPDFVRYMHSVHNIAMDARMVDIAAWAMENIELKREATVRVGRRMIGEQVAA